MSLDRYAGNRNSEFLLLRQSILFWIRVCPAGAHSGIGEALLCFLEISSWGGGTAVSDRALHRKMALVLKPYNSFSLFVSGMPQACPKFLDIFKEDCNISSGWPPLAELATVCDLDRAGSLGVIKLGLV